MAKISPSDSITPVTRPLHLDTTNLIDDNFLSAPAMFMEHSPGLSTKIKIPKRHYSTGDPLERMATPMFDKEEVRQRKKGPSSAATVLAMSGLFVVGVTLMASGIIVLILIRNCI
ncbi:unnamed protein product [Auanema sp. JU1783]|nr:unnamed protein product [Auanema sp. JU1783]